MLWICGGNSFFEEVQTMMNEQQGHTSPFETIRQLDEHGNEYWSARDFYRLLDYSKYDNFKVAIEKAKKACEGSNEATSDHFLLTRKMIKTGKGAQRSLEDYHLSRYACYLIIQNADPEKELVALGQTYFAVQTRRQELADEDTLAGLTEDQKRLLVRNQLSLHNVQLAETASQAGVITSRDFAIFQDHGYKGLYGGLGAKDIHMRKDLKKSQKILDHMNSAELAANLFRSTQAEERIRNKAIQTREGANQEHHKTGEEIRALIAKGGGTLPEDQPTPTRSIQQLQREEQKRLENGQQPSLFEELEE
jgi:DNA-damage-inducible protein D